MASIASILTALTAAKELVLTAGPGTLRHLGDIMDKLADASRGIASYIEKMGGGTPEVQMALNNDRETHVAKLQQLKAEVDTAIIMQQPEAALGDRIGGLLGKMDPATKKAILGLISGLLGQLLGKLGVGATTTA